ncbi:hypothetical protein DMA11_11440 [Marinilabiliaceae bacterium JC017]|nr:hypothetical protein DMA11_11440 [Marinilabiliaceae bacterium JC017]
MTCSGKGKVNCFNPGYDATILMIELQEVKKVVVLWLKEYEGVGGNNLINYEQLFKRRRSNAGSCVNLLYEQI